MQGIYEKTYPISSTEVDVYGNCRPSALLSFFQDMGGEHSEATGTGRDYLMSEYHAFWMLVRVWYRLDRPLKTGERLSLRTWQRGCGGLIVYRDFDLLVDGRPVGEAVSAWVVADFESRKMLRPGRIRRLVEAPVPDCVKDRQLKLIRTPKDLREVYRRTVRYSDLDINGHMNNTKYADVLLDALQVRELKGRFISELQLNYSLECRAGETMTIFRGLEAEPCYIDGRGDDGARRFEAIVQFQPNRNTALDETAVNR